MDGWHGTLLIMYIDDDDNHNIHMLIFFYSILGEQLLPKSFQLFLFCTGGLKLFHTSTGA